MAVAGGALIACTFSCPLMTSDAMGRDVGHSPVLVVNFCGAVKRGCTVPMVGKMWANIGEMWVVGVAAQGGGAVGSAAINTLNDLTTL
ncbi:NAD-dependent dihydropyrimidine dehydrogenase subunit PreA, partial [Escherichia coli]